MSTPINHIVDTLVTLKEPSAEFPNRVMRGSLMPRSDGMVGLVVNYSGVLRDFSIPHGSIQYLEAIDPYEDQS